MSSLHAQKFAPKDGEVLVFIGQDLAAVGGLDDYSEGYVDYFPTPAGVTVYTGLSSSGESYGYHFQGLDGIKTKANWGAGDNWADIYIQDSTFCNTMIAIGLSMVDYEKEIANGKADHLIQELGTWIKSSQRPVFLRVGYEFDGWEWNHYKKKYYLQAWQRIHRIFEQMEVDNAVFVWQSKGVGSGQDILEEWYPGDDLVDWCGYSYFGKPDTEMLTFARKHNKPVFIAEVSPVRQMDNVYFDTDLKKEKLGEVVWREWFEPFFKTIEDNPDVIKAFSYINANWMAQPMWVSNPVFNQVDSRIQVNEFISKKWQEKIKKANYLHASDELFQKLNSK